MRGGQHGPQINRAPRRFAVRQRIGQRHRRRAALTDSDAAAA
jgi:hypothetical protein